VPGACAPRASVNAGFRKQMNSDSPSRDRRSVVNKRKAKFLDGYLKSYNNLCKLFAHVAENEKEESHTVVEVRTSLLVITYIFILSVQLFVVLFFYLLPFIGE